MQVKDGSIFLPSLDVPTSNSLAIMNEFHTAKFCTQQPQRFMNNSIQHFHYEVLLHQRFGQLVYAIFHKKWTELAVFSNFCNGSSTATYYSIVNDTHIPTLPKIWPAGVSTFP